MASSSSSSIPTFNSSGYLPEGIYQSNLTEFKDRFVNDFSNSRTRSDLFKGYVRLTKGLLNTARFEKQWIDGSYTTNKVDPRDVDLVSFVDGNDTSISTNQTYQDIVDQIMMDEYGCDSYIVPIFSDGDYRKSFYDKNIKYWKNRWGKDRKGQDKGFIEFDLTNSDNIVDLEKEVNGK
jgi:hypothetical protein